MGVIEPSLFLKNLETNTSEEGSSKSIRIF